MFWETNVKEYRVTHPNRSFEDMTENELWDWFIRVRPDSTSWFEFKGDLAEKGEVRFNNGSIVLLLSEKANVGTKTDTQINKCWHTETFVNHAGGVKFKQCVKCKKDLGDI